MRLVNVNKIYNQDCIAFMDNLIRNNKNVKIDIIITSPPYNIKKKYFSYKDNKELKKYISWMGEVSDKSYKILNPKGSFFLNIAGTPSQPLIPFLVLQKFLDSGFVLQNTIHWIKSISIEEKDIGNNNKKKSNFSIGHFKPITSKRYLSDMHEYIFHFSKTGDLILDKFAIGVPYQDKTNIKRWKTKNQDKRDRGNTWFIAYSTIQSSREHPAVFPEKLPQLCIKLHGLNKRNSLLVYDPFMGIGSTALACLDLGVNFIGTEIDANYIRIANSFLRKRKKEIKDKNNNDK